jgi:ADP-heptose:LPS heptosyltransferase|tara:strand:+ start:13702 stop:14673 length:972 start_codon:yes stop_codon:yes gene_type:complete
MIDFNNKKILLVRNDNVGDLICTTPSIEALRKKYQNTKIDIVVNSYNFDAINKNPFVDKIYCYTKPKHKKSFFDKLKAGLGKLSILINIFKEKYDVVIVFRSDYSKSAELFSNITNAKYKIGVKNPKGKDNFNVHIPVDNKKHEVEFCFDCLESLGVKYEKERTRYYIPNELSDKYKEYSNHILFHISSRIKDNQYSNDNFLKVINELKNYNILISAEPVDFDNAKYIESNSHAKFIKTSSLNDLGGLISNVKLFITLDGGAMHLGSALGIKTISISGKTNMDKWYPWGYKEYVIQDKTKVSNNISPSLIIEKIKGISSEITY